MQKMIKVKILGFDLEADFLNPDVREKYESTISGVVQASNESLNCDTTSESIRRQCEAVINCLDTFFGKGTAQKIFRGGTNLLECLDAFEEYCNIYGKYVDPLVKKRAAQAAAKNPAKLVRQGNK